MAGAVRAALYFALVATARGTAVSLTNPSFEGAGGWTPLATGDSELFAPVAGAKYATATGGGSPMTQDAGVTLEAGTTYTLSVYARSVDESYPPLLPGSLTSGTHKEVIANVSLKASGTVVATKTVVVSAPQLKGVAAKDNSNAASDDGANVWLEGGYRMHTAERLFYQAESADPISDPWLDGDETFACMAKGPIVTSSITSQLKAVYGTFYDDTFPVLSRIDRVDFTGTPPTGYVWASPTGSDAAGDKYVGVLSHSGDEKPWAIDAHIYEDADTKRLWMTWGGHALWVCELTPDGQIMDPNTGAAVASPDFTTHATSPLAVHTRILAWQPDFVPPGYPASATDAPLDDDGEWAGDGLSDSYMEGPSLWKHTDSAAVGGKTWWYACGSYGGMGSNYNIRCCRSEFLPSDASTGARGPYYDRAGQACLDYDSTKNKYGATMLLGADGDQLVPGHPHMWSEADGQDYLGYDYRVGCVSEAVPGQCTDVMGIRELEWVEDEGFSTDDQGWPTIWTKIEVTLDTATTPSAVGQTLSIDLSNTGDATSIAAFDFVRLEKIMVYTVHVEGDLSDTTAADVAEATETAVRDTLPDDVRSNATISVVISETAEIVLTFANASDAADAAGALQGELCAGTTACVVTEQSSRRDRRRLDDTLAYELTRTYPDDAAVTPVADTSAPEGSTLESAETTALDAAATVTGASDALGDAPTPDDAAVTSAVEAELGDGVEVAVSSGVAFPPAAPPASPPAPDDEDEDEGEGGDEDEGEGESNIDRLRKYAPYIGGGVGGLLLIITIIVCVCCCRRKTPPPPHPDGNPHDVKRPTAVVSFLRGKEARRAPTKDAYAADSSSMPAGSRLTTFDYGGDGGAYNEPGAPPSLPAVGEYDEGYDQGYGQGYDQQYGAAPSGGYDEYGGGYEQQYDAYGQPVRKCSMPMTGFERQSGEI